MAGNNDRIHGYNSVYRKENGPINFYSFNWEGSRPSKFINRIVVVTGSNPPKPLDHQGHIVPQGMLNKILDSVQKDMAKCKNEKEIEDFINKNKAEYEWLPYVYEYGKAINAPMFDFDESDPEDKTGGFFSIVTWNPVNICRAPEDKERNGYPGKNIDEQVADYLDKYKTQLKVNADYLKALNNLINSQTNDNINKVITAGAKTLGDQEKTGTGYYSFPWEKVSNVLQPDMDQAPTSLKETNELAEAN